jgi:hypothetical protein
MNPEGGDSRQEVTERGKEGNTERRGENIRKLKGSLPQ